MPLGWVCLVVFSTGGCLIVGVFDCLMWVLRVVGGFATDLVLGLVWLLAHDCGLVGGTGFWRFLRLCVSYGVGII